MVESSLDFFSGRLTKKERKATLADELLSDKTLTQYRFDIYDILLLFAHFASEGKEMGMYMAAHFESTSISTHSLCTLRT